MTRPARSTGWLAIVVLIMLGQAVLPAPGDSILWKTVLDAGHVPLFGLFAYVVLRWSRRARPWTGRSGLRPYLVAFLAVAAMGAATEGIQTLGSRDADAADLARNLMGGAAALILAATADRELAPGGRRVRSLLVPGAAVLLGVSLLPLGQVALSYYQRNRDFPRLLDFQGAWGHRFLQTRDARIELRAEADTGRPGMRLTFLPARYPALLVREPYPDWRAYVDLACEILSENEEPLDLVLRIHDSHHDNSYADRFNQTLCVEPGLNRFLIPLQEVRDGPAERSLDLAHVAGIALFAVSPARPVTIHLREMTLEPDRPSRAAETTSSRSAPSRERAFHPG